VWLPHVIHNNIIHKKQIQKKKRVHSANALLLSAVQEAFYCSYTHSSVHDDPIIYHRGLEESKECYPNPKHSTPINALNPKQCNPNAINGRDCGIPVCGR
jgi:hypothetical protein